MRVLLATGSAARHMLPPTLGEEQVVCGPDWPNAKAPGGRVVSLATPVGEYDLAAVSARLPLAQVPDVVVCLVDSAGRNRPRNLDAFRCPRVLLIADTHHQESPLIGLLRYAAGEPFERLVFLYDRHHAGCFAAAGFTNLFWFPGLTFPHDDATVRAARRALRTPQLAFVGQAGRFHPRRNQLLDALVRRGLPVERSGLAQREALGLYGGSLAGFNASLNGDLNLRVIEILASGAALLTDQLAPDSGLGALWTDGKELLTYGGAEELAERAAQALAHPAETAAIGAAGARWFDEHLFAARRQQAFARLALDGIAVPEFALPASAGTRVSFGGDTDRLLEAITVYEDLQEAHRVQEQVTVALGTGVPDDFAHLCATLPRAVVIREDAPPAATDVAVFDRTAAAAPDARLLWCWNATEADAADWAVRLLASGHVQRGGPVARYDRVETPAAAPAAAGDDRPHVLLYTDDPDSGGVAQYNHSLLLGLVAAGFRVSCAQSRCASPLVAVQREHGIAHHWIPYDTKREFPRTLEDARGPMELFAALQPDLVVFSDCSPFSNFAAREVALQTGLPYLSVIGFVGAYLAERFARLVPALSAQYAAARAVVAVSRENLDLLRARFGLGADQGVVVHYGRPARFFAPRDEAVRARLRAGLDLPEDAVVAFTAARLAPVKGYLHQVEALRMLAGRPAGRRLHAVWAGEGEQRAQLQRALRTAGLWDRVHLLGQTWNVADWYDAADFFVLPSELEGMPLAIMEAMAKGLPVAATAVSGIPEELGETGRLLPAAARGRGSLVCELARTLEAWTLDPELRQRVGEAGRRRAAEMFREERMIGLTIGLVRGALARASIADHKLAVNG